MTVDQAVARRNELVDRLVARGIIRSSSVESAFRAVPRELFVPQYAAEEGIPAVYQDRPIVIKSGPQGQPMSSSSQPTLMAAMLERLAVERGQRVLEIGTGTGYNAALLAHLTGDPTLVSTMEFDTAVASQAAKNLKRYGQDVRVVAGDGLIGFPEAGPYDRIICTASSAAVRRSWIEQAGNGCLIQVPLLLSICAFSAQSIVTFRRDEDACRSIDSLPGQFMPLADEDITEGNGTHTHSEGDVHEHSTDEMPWGITVGSRHVRGLSLGRREYHSRAERLLQDPPEMYPLGRRIRPGRITPFLAVAIGDGDLVVHRSPGRPYEGIGLACSDGLALLTGGDRLLTKIEGFGAPKASVQLRDYVRDWDGLGRPSSVGLSAVVYIEDTSPPKHWRVIRRDGMAIGIDFHGS